MKEWVCAFVTGGQIRLWRSLEKIINLNISFSYDIYIIICFLLELYPAFLRFLLFSDIKSIGLKGLVKCNPKIQRFQFRRHLKLKVHYPEYSRYSESIQIWIGHRRIRGGGSAKGL